MRLVSGAMATESRLVPRYEDQVDVTGALERLFDKGIVIDPWARVSASGIDLVTDPTRIVVASIETYSPHPRGVPGPAPKPGV